MTILLTGFRRYGRENSNPTSQLVKILHGRTVREHKIFGKELRVSTRDVSKRLPALIDSMRPILVLGLGLAPRRVHITPERVAVNCSDFSIPDAAGYRPVDKSIDPLGPVAYFASIPIRKIVNALSKRGIPASVSNTAGAYICNYTMYTSLNHIAKRGMKTRSGFIHVPCTPPEAAEKSEESGEQVPSISLGCMKDAILTAIRVSLGPI